MPVLQTHRVIRPGHECQHGRTSDTKGLGEPLRIAAARSNTVAIADGEHANDALRSHSDPADWL
jgi:hypothetical protein